LFLINIISYHSLDFSLGIMGEAGWALRRLLRAVEDKDGESKMGMGLR
jgi:hypothetical protein